jgi:hypothetical protein
MAELWSVLATEDACDLAMRAPGAGRVAMDEVFVAGRLPEDLRAAIAKVDPAALIRDASEGWEVIALARDDAEAIWPRLSELPLPEPPGYVQGAFAGVPVRALVTDVAVALHVRPPVVHHVHHRIEETSA